MKVVELKSKILFGQFYPQVPSALPEGLKFAATAVLTFVAPSLAYSYVTGQAESLYLTACQVVIGTILGASLYHRGAADFLSVVPRWKERKEKSVSQRAA